MHLRAQGAMHASGWQHRGELESAMLWVKANGANVFGGAFSKALTERCQKKKKKNIANCLAERTVRFPHHQGRRLLALRDHDAAGRRDLRHGGCSRGGCRLRFGGLGGARPVQLSGLLLRGLAASGGFAAGAAAAGGGLRRGFAAAAGGGCLRLRALRPRLAWRGGVRPARRPAAHRRRVPATDSAVRHSRRHGCAEIGVDLASRTPVIDAPYDRACDLLLVDPLSRQRCRPISSTARRLSRERWAVDMISAGFWVLGGLGLPRRLAEVTGASAGRCSFAALPAHRDVGVADICAAQRRGLGVRAVSSLAPPACVAAFAATPPLGADRAAPSATS